MENNGIKGFLKRFLPMPSLSLNSRLERLQDLLEKQNNDISNLLKKTDELQKQNNDISGLVKKTYELQKNNNEISSLVKKTNELQKQNEQLSEKLEITRKITAENNWADVYNSTVEGSQWLKQRSFSPRRWALGYPSFYVLYRTLNEIHPKSILDIGLGQSSWMIAQYAATDESISHMIVEHDPKWIEFFTAGHKLPENSKIVQLDWNMTTYKEACVREYGGFDEAFKGRKFELILIDGPLSGDMKEYARIDVLKRMPEILEKNFIILIDDSHRIGEKNTINEMKTVLQENNIAFSEGNYSGIKNMTILCAESLNFLTTM